MKHEIIKKLCEKGHVIVNRVKLIKKKLQQKNEHSFNKYLKTTYMKLFLLIHFQITSLIA